MREQTPAEKRRRDATREVENAVFRLVGDEARDAGPADYTKGYEDRGIYPGSTITRRFPLPGPDLRASMDVLYAAREQVRHAVDNARGSGLSWAEIGGYLGFEAASRRAGMDLGRAEWRVAAMGVFPGQPDAEDAWTSPYGPTARWSCRTCHGSISERDPVDGVQAQRGHNDGCTRYARELSEQRARWDEEDQQ